MDEEISIPISIPIADDGFLSRECPTCERRFKWFVHSEGDPDAEQVDQYFCPLCGVPAGTDAWATPEQIEYAFGAAGPEIDQAVQEAIGNAFGGVKGISFEVDRNFSLEIETPAPPVEPDGFVTVESPCHPNEPIQVPESVTSSIHCLVCGTAFAV